jgi:hypothetical protein
MAASGIQLTARRRFGQFLITKPVAVEIDGASVGEARWGNPQFFGVSAGSHQLTLSFRYLGKKRTGEASMTIEIAADQTVDVLYRSPWVLTNKGSLTIG